MNAFGWKTICIPKVGKICGRKKVNNRPVRKNCMIGAAHHFSIDFTTLSMSPIKLLLMSLRSCGVKFWGRGTAGQNGETAEQSRRQYMTGGSRALGQS